MQTARFNGRELQIETRTNALDADAIALFATQADPIRSSVLAAVADSLHGPEPTTEDLAHGPTQDWQDTLVFDTLVILEPLADGTPVFGLTARGWEHDKGLGVLLCGTEVVDVGYSDVVR